MRRVRKKVCARSLPHLQELQGIILHIQLYGQGGKTIQRGAQGSKERKEKQAMTEERDIALINEHLREKLSLEEYQRLTALMFHTLDNLFFGKVREERK